MEKLIECVPNFSEGRDMNIINRIAEEIRSVEGVRLLNVDPGKATNRTVITFAGTPDAVCEAAFKAVKMASGLIDMRKHKGEHPRFGATDVLPLIPLSGITMEETVVYAENLGKRIGSELNIPVYLYEYAASEEKRRNLANCRSGEYEGLPEKLTDPEWKPDFGPAEFNAMVANAGAIAVGARNFLIAYNINLNTSSTRIANSIAFDIREKGRVKRIGNPLTGIPVKDENGELVYEPGMLKGVKGIGWYIEEYGISQLSFNITDITLSSVHAVFEAACERAAIRGVRVTGSELIGLIPLQAMLDAGTYFLKKQHRSIGIPDDEIIKIAIKSLGLDELTPFNPKERIIEYMISDFQENKLAENTLAGFTRLTASESPTPGGGSVSALLGALGAALGTMVANLSSHKKGWDDKWEYFSDWAVKGKNFYEQLLKLIDEDTNAYNDYMKALQLPKKSQQEIEIRKEAIQKSVINAIEIPLHTMRLSYASMEVIKAMAESGNPNSVSDAGVGAIAARAAVAGAGLNVRINIAGMADKELASQYMDEAVELENKAVIMESDILNLVIEKICNK
ncbi:MAG: glutamate formimidoyltransferase [Prolixibacteraceae bacterium]|nr:glutamate formimidoyltransferase [Prolixibacteraceae bacterium]